MPFPVLLLNAHSGADSNRELETLIRAGSGTVEIKIHCHGTKTSASAEIPLQITDIETQKIIATPLVPSCGVAPITLPLSPSPTLPLMFSLPADTLALDNAQAGVIQREDSGQILIVDGEPGRRANESESFYLREALKTAPGGLQWTIITQQEFEQWVKTKENSLAAGVSQLWLLHPQKMGKETLQFVDRFLAASGKKMVVSLGPSADLAALSKLTGLAFQLNPAPIEGQKLKLSGKDNRWIGEIPLSSVHEFEVANITVSNYASIADSSVGKTWMALENGAPILFEPSGRPARVFIFTSTFDTLWTNMPLKGFFAALVHSLALEPTEIRMPANVIWGETTILPIPTAFWKNMKLRSPSGMEIAPRFRESQMILGPFEEPGFYEILFPGLSVRPAGAPRWIACRLPPRFPESDLSPASSKQKNALLGASNFWKEIPAAAAARDPKKALQALASEPLARPFLFAAILLLGAESMVSWIFAKRGVKRKT